ncbi:hypothetical protein ACHWQZ_G005904 [Mnemiopsis leidyi]
MSSGKKNKIEYKVQLLDDSTISCRVEKGSKGEELINQVCTFLELEEKDFFGLCYFHAKQGDLSCWLQSKKPIHKQIGTSAGGYQFRFRVKFYPPDPARILQKEMTRYSFVCQLKKDIAEERLTCSANTECMLAAYALQAEMGDFDSEEYHEEGYIQQCAWFCDVTPSMEENIKEAHKSLRGRSPAEADVQFLDIARKLELYGIHQFEAVDKHGAAIHVAAVWNGIHIFRCGSKQNSYPWSKVYKLDFKGRHFYIIFRANVEGPGKDTVILKFVNKQCCKLFWRRCVEYHAFFRLKRRDYAASKLSLPPTASSTQLTRGTAGRSTISGASHHYSEFTDLKRNNHSTPRSREAEDVQLHNGDRSLTLDRSMSRNSEKNMESRGYSTLPPNYRKQNSDTISSKFNSSVDSGSYRLGTGTSQDVLSDVIHMSDRDARASANEIFKNTQLEAHSKEEFVALFQQISQELNKEQLVTSSPELKHPDSRESPALRTSSPDRQFTTEIREETRLPSPQLHQTNGVSPVSPNNCNAVNASSLTKVSSVASMPSRTSSRGSLASETVDFDNETPITIPLDLILDVGKSMPDTGFANYLSRYSKAGYSRLHAVSQEFVYTEKTYVKILGVLNTFLREITIPNGPFNNAQMLLLSNLYEMHQKFLRQLEDRLVAWTNETRTLNISDVLARNLCLFTLYTDYINDYNLTMERFNTCLQGEAVFSKHVIMFEGRSSSIVSIPNLLLYPVLRMKQYQELVDRLIGCIGENDPSYPDFNEVFHELNASTPPLTQELPKIMNFTVLQSLETELLGIKEIPVLGRVFLRRGMVRHVTPGRSVTRTLILLSDCLLCCRRDKDKQLFVLGMYHVKDIEVEESREENLFGFLVTLLDTGVTLEFHVEDPHDSEKWVHDLKFTTSIYRKRRKPEFLPTLTNSPGGEDAVQELCMVCGITLGRDKRQRTCKLCNKVLCTRCSSWKLALPGHAEMQRVCESCYSRGDVRHRDMELTQYTVQPPLISYGGDDMLSMEQLSGYVYVRSQNRTQWRRRWLELIFSKLFFYETDDDVKPLGTLDMLHLQVADTKYSDHVSANYAFKISSKTFSIIVACETAYSLKRWLQVLEKATLSSNPDVY